MQPVNQAEEEIGSAILVANFSRAVQVAEEWLKSFEITDLKSEAARRASSSYFIARFFSHRQERFSRYTPGVERARLFLSVLSEFDRMVSEEEAIYSAVVARAARLYCHAQIAEGLARDFAGQKAYNLNPEEMLQLAVSLLEIEKWRSAEDVLRFMLQQNRRSPQVNYLLAYAAYRQNREDDFYRFFRDALFIKPDVVSQYPAYLPGGIFTDLYRRVADTGFVGSLQDRTFAMLAEIQGLYPITLEISRDEAAKIEQDYRKLREEFRSRPHLQDELLPRLLHFLCWLVLYHHNQHDFDRMDEFRAEMIELDPGAWELFAEKNLK